MLFLLDVDLIDPRSTCGLQVDEGGISGGTEDLLVDYKYNS